MQELSNEPSVYNVNNNNKRRVRRECSRECEFIMQMPQQIERISVAVNSDDTMSKSYNLLTHSQFGLIRFGNHDIIQ